MDPQVVKTLHDAFKKGMEDPIHMQAMEKYDQDLIYMSGEDYAKFARKAFEDEKAVAARLATTQAPRRARQMSRAHRGRLQPDAFVSTCANEGNGRRLKPDPQAPSLILWVRLQPDAFPPTQQQSHSG